MDKKALALMTLKHITHDSSVRNFSWRRVRECLRRFPDLVDKKTAFIWDDIIFIEMLWSNCLLMLGEKRVGICGREYPPKPKFTALPPKDVQLSIQGILERYGRTYLGKEDAPTVH